MFRKYRSVISPISDATKTQNNIIIFFFCAMKGYKTAFLKLFFILVSNNDGSKEELWYLNCKRYTLKMDCTIL